MRLSYRDKIILFFVVIFVTLAAGILLVINPKISEISTSKENYTAKIEERNKVDSELDQAKTINATVKKLIEQTEEATAPFFTDLKTYEIDQYIKEKIDTNGIINTNLSITPLTMASIDYYSTSKNNGGENLADQSSKSDSKNKNDSSSKEQALKQGETAMKATVTFNYKCSSADFIKFLDKIDLLDQTAIISAFNYAEADAGGTYTGSITIDLYCISQAE